MRPGRNEPCHCGSGRKYKHCHLAIDDAPPERRVYRCVGLSRNESGILVQSVLDELADALIGGEAVKLSSFGRFFVRSKSERIGRNPKTGIEVPIAERRVMVFKPSNVLKARINGMAVADEEDA